MDDVRALAQFVGRIGCERLNDAAEGIRRGVAMPAGVEVELRRQRRWRWRLVDGILCES